MKIIEDKYFAEYHKIIGKEIDSLCKDYDFSEKRLTPGYITQASAVYSSNIEGNSIDLNSFMNYQMTKDKFKPQKEVEEIENLITAYEYAQTNELNEKNFLCCHEIFSKTLLIKSNRGKYREEKVGVFDNSGLVYLAVEWEFVKDKMKQLFEEFSFLLEKDLSFEKTFYFASLIHLFFVHIHPFNDGNGRAARLIEKWFLAETLGGQYWNILSEKYYKEHQSEYYNNINLGVNYYELDYDKCLPFLSMLPNSLK